MSRSSSERSTPRLGAKSGAKLLLPDDMAKFFRDFFSKKFQRKRNGLKTSHVAKMFFRARRGQRGSQRGTARERRLAGAAATEPRHGKRAAAALRWLQGGWLHYGGRDEAAAWRTGLAARLGVPGRRLGGRHGEGGRDGAAAWRTGGGGKADGCLGGRACGTAGLRHGWGL